MSRTTRDRRRRARASMSRGRRAMSRVLGILSCVLLLAAAAVGGYLVWDALQPDEPQGAPVPAQDFVYEGEGTTGPAEADIDGDAFGPEDMAPSSMLIPALDAYSPIDAESGFQASKYAGFDSMTIPLDNSRSGWYQPGGALYGGDEGTTLVASHITSRGYGWGVLKDLWTLQGGELIYTKDAEGRVQTWRVSEMSTKYHTDFPQDYWDADGVRRLVVTTCGGQLTSWGTYQYNIFVIAEPVDPKPRTAAQRLADSLPELVPTLLTQTEEAREKKIREEQEEQEEQEKMQQERSEEEQTPASTPSA